MRLRSELQYIQGNQTLEVFFDVSGTAPNDLQREQTLGQSPFTFAITGLPEITRRRQIRMEPVAESVELRWLRTHGAEIAGHRGEWLLIINDRLAASSREFAEIRRMVDRERIESPFVYYVPTEEESNFTLI